jgi:hypothetical protein
MSDESDADSGAKRADFFPVQKISFFFAAALLLFLAACLFLAATQRPPRDRLPSPSFSSHTHQTKQLVQSVKAPGLKRQGDHEVPHRRSVFFSTRD